MSVFRAALTITTLLSVVLTHNVMATELLAKADTRMAVTTEYEPAQIQNVSSVVVRKGERRLYLMNGDDIVRSYRISLGDNPKGHKLYQGDERTPEGNYTLDWRNAESDFYKSIHISYPSERDRELASAWGLDPGGSIMIHGLPNDAGDLAFAFTGLDWTDGCIAVTNEEMDEIWQLVSNGTPISIHP
ncbi:L,D-transpeptidase family protein [Marinobacter sp. F3R08]|uniref:L,D-transpeptidase family protein n=1 Tax=Marinobacter sp. F3R08 TaxID=2841559 RepID=UPI001C0A3BE8|nr:L,D-transpeptidase family protein [Marinobacter sp. F3R08]MBU2952816.1 L,D-transpeptidase family protein [Marinobacter sp. F3R08]